MNRLKRLVRELHRRSLWQILAIFLAASWGVIQFVDFLTVRAGLPDWTPSMALALLLIGLPIVLATAFVQEGMPGGDGAVDGEAGRADDPSAPARPAPAPHAPLAPPPEATGIHRFLTWRNALLGGVGAFALLGASVFTYFVMWSTGIGPVGNLVAQGIIEEGDRVILATFTDQTGEGLGEVVTGALRVDLAQAAMLSLVEDVDVAPVLARMQVEPGTLLTAELAREVAVREGIGAVIDGDVARAGSGYLITAALREAGTGRSLAAFRVTARNPDDVIPAMDRLSREIRGKSGESLRSVRAGEPLEQVTTRSLEALRLFTEADRAFSQGDFQQTLELLDQAVTVDPEFAMAWRRMAAALSNTGTDPQRHDHAATQAYRHRDRLTERERHLADAYYHSYVERDRARAVAAYQSVLRIAPDDRAALNNLANEYMSVEDFARAQELYRRAVDGPGRSNTAYANLIRAHFATADFADAEAVYQEFRAAYPDNRRLPEWAFWVTFLQGDLEAARAAISPLTDDPGLPAFVRAGAVANLGLASYREGKLDEGRAHMLAAERVAGEVGPAFQLLQRQWTVHAEDVLGDRDWALRHARAALDEGAFFQLDPAARPWLFVALNLAHLADGERAGAVLEGWETFLVERGATRLDLIDVDWMRAVLDVATGRLDGALERAQDLAAEAGCPTCWMWERALAAARTGHTDEAIRLYEKIRWVGSPNLPLNSTIRTQAVLLLGPLYEEAGDAAGAIEAYQRVVDLWAHADARGMERVREAEARITALREPTALGAGVR
jgi:eukaryotic-like serine/threonine-protein kinase